MCRRPRLSLSLSLGALRYLKRENKLLELGVDTDSAAGLTPLPARHAEALRRALGLREGRGPGGGGGAAEGAGADVPRRAPASLLLEGFGAEALKEDMYSRICSAASSSLGP